MEKLNFMYLGADEIGQLGNAFKKMARNLHMLIAKVKAQVDFIAASSEELPAGAHQSAEAGDKFRVIAESVIELTCGIQS